jgi:putative hydrolase of the HAD superfamily
MIDVIALDADDTLWENEIHYIKAKAEFVRLLGEYHQREEWIEQRLDEIENDNVSIYGYGIKSFTLSMLETAIEISGGRIHGADLERVIALGRGMLTTPVELFPHTRVVLETLSPHWDLMLITKGDQFEQKLKIDRTGLAGYFRQVEIVGEKTPASYHILLERHRIDPQRFLMVGNSLRSDILPVLALGGQAVYIPYANTWAHENDTGSAGRQHGYYELENLGQLPDLINRLAAG